MINNLITMIGGNFTSEICWNANVHGWDTYVFHQLCDFKGPTITLIRANTGFIFGGVAYTSWNANCDCY